MPWFLRVQDGDRFRDAAVLDEAQAVVIGRAETADLVFPHDHQMSSRHLSVTLQNGVCQFTDLHSTNGSFLGDERVQQGELKPGDRLRCGGTVFCVEAPGRRDDSPHSSSETPKKETGKATVTAATARTWIPQAEPSAVNNQPQMELPPEMQQTKGYVAGTAAEVVERFELQELISMSPEGSELPGDFVARLEQSEGEDDCLNFLAYALPKRMGIWWVLQCLASEDGLTTDKDAAVLKATHDWVKTPTDQLRRLAMEEAEAIEMGTAAAWAAVAAFWSIGGMGPEGQAEIPAQDNMAGKAISAAAILAAVTDPPQNAPQRRAAFVQLADKVAQGELPWE
ncbi:MAG: FHA domain-containing protein [Planctomycetaceae bacterium]